MYDPKDIDVSWDLLSFYAREVWGPPSLVSSWVFSAFSMRSRRCLLPTCCSLLLLLRYSQLRVLGSCSFVSELDGEGEGGLSTARVSCVVSLSLSEILTSRLVLWLRRGRNFRSTNDSSHHMHPCQARIRVLRHLLPRKPYKPGSAHWPMAWLIDDLSSYSVANTRYLYYLLRCGLLPLTAGSCWASRVASDGYNIKLQHPQCIMYVIFHQ